MSKKKKFDPIKRLEKGAVLVPIRKECNCHAQYHSLINNCLSCGKIVCEQEGEGPCFFCGNIILRADADIERHQLFEQMKNEETIFDLEYKKAKDHKDKLVNYDRNSKNQSNIYDEQTDWFTISEDIYMSKEAREIAVREIVKTNIEQEENSKLIHLEFKGVEEGFSEKKFVVDKEKQRADAQAYEREMMLRENEERINQIEESESGDWSKGKESVSELRQAVTGFYHQKYADIIKKNIKGNGAPQAIKPQSRVVQLEEDDDFREMFEKSMNEAKSKTMLSEKDFDEELYDLERTDRGMCLSMLQPWASLLVEGFKRFEGRHWSHGYRGPLWIHAGATPPSTETIKAVEAQYKEFYQGVKDMPKLPDRYPTGSLIGMVDLQSIIAKEEYEELVQERYREESSSRFLFVVRNPRKLQLPIKMSGNKDIFQIDEDLRKIASKCLRKVRTSWFPYVARELKTDNMMVISKEVVSDVLRRYELFGVILTKLLKENELLSINDFARDALASRKQIGNKNNASVELNNNFPHLDKLISAFPVEKKDLIKGLKTGELFYINSKQKKFTFEKHSVLMLCIGNSFELHVDDLKEHVSKSFKVANGHVIILDHEEKEISFVKTETGEELEYEMKRDACTLFVLLNK